MIKITLLVVTALICRTSEACSCIPTPSVEESLRTSGAVLDGTVIALEDRYVGFTKAKVWLQERFGYFNHSPVDTGFAIRVRVHESWKGKANSELVLFTSRSSAECGYPVQVGERYVVYAFKLDDGSYEVSLCSRTAPHATASQDVSVLSTLSESKKF